MEYNRFKNQSGVFANQDMLELLKRCRSLHDEVVFEFFTRLVKMGQKRLNKLVTILMNRDDRSCQQDRVFP